MRDMIVFKCDCKGCNNTGVKLNSLTIDTVEGDTATYDICSDCLCKIQNIINSDRAGRKVITMTEVVGEECITPVINEHDTTSIECNNSKSNITAVIEAYGIDKFKEEYCVNGRSIPSLALELNVNKSSLAQWVSRNGIRKRKAKDKETETSCDSKEDN